MNLPLGFYLARTGVQTASSPRVPYRGIDRLPYIPTPKEEEELRLAGRRRLADLWVEYADAEYDKTFVFDSQLALDYQRKFFDEGIRFEVIYGEIVFVPENLEQYALGDRWMSGLNEALRRWHQTLPQSWRNPTDLAFLGVDISHPFPTFHSAIYQPGLHESRPDLIPELNRSGLFGDIGAALPFLECGNRMGYGALPFCLVEVRTFEA